ncbi:N-acetylneuraminate synthase family protein [Bowmanella denitrificans]|uniref:N-acetylneuraminate synthase family protein n=1 Tax=Bowmanella denitrificans TaxID=366582 RepID=A0ABP3HB83_9ALTE
MQLNIGKFEIGANRTFVIAEIGNNHNGDLARAKELVDLAVEMGVDCVKFQMRHLDQLYRKSSLQRSGNDLGTEYILDLLSRFELSLAEHRQLADYCLSKHILYLCTPWDASSVEILESFGVPAYKVASADLTNIPLLSRLVKTGKPLILSTGMSTEEEVRMTVDFLNAHGVAFVLLHCNSTYPAPLHDIQLRWMETLRALHPLVGYSGHERGIAVSLAAVALGAKVIERHFTLDRTMEGPDHAASLEPSEFKALLTGIREIEQSLGSNQHRQLSQGEMINRENLGKSLVAAKSLKREQVLTETDIMVRSPGQGLSPQCFMQLVGKTLQRDMQEEDFFFPSDLKEIAISPGQYRFSRPWGVPVRYHDFNQYRALVKPDFFEFHLSYADMDLPIGNYLSGTYDMDFIVHAPELFANSRLMDLASQDEQYRRYSIAETQRVIDITRALKSYFPSTARPMIVANIGGFTMDAPMNGQDRTRYYETFADSLQYLDLDGVELIPQTMAPFPWHFGGQRYQNLFVDADESLQWCERLGLRMCFDVSHSRLTCNHFGQDFYQFARKLAKVTAHLHLGDAKGVNGEGLQIGEGDLDFARLAEVLREGCPQAPFIPEIWQGHKNNGEGFWIALERLNGVL